MSRAASFLSQGGRTMTEPSFSPDEIVGLVAPRLIEVESLFHESLASPVAIVDEIGEFVGQSGGKRVRPTLHLLAADLCGYRGPHAVLLATVLEFIHSATLMHDDVIDAAETRRGRPSVNRQWGNTITVLFGDYLYAKAMKLALRAENLRVMDRLAWITLRMTEGEMMQTRLLGRLDVSIDQYMDLIERKTAVLFGGCCQLAGILAGVDAPAEEALREYGTEIGLAFQIVDDILDFTGDPLILGKPTVSDLAEGKATLPIVDLLGRDLPRAHAIVERVCAGNGTDADRRELIGRLHESGSLERAQARARHHAERAVNRLDAFPDSPARRALTGVPDLLIARNR